MVRKVAVVVPAGSPTRPSRCARQEQTHLPRPLPSGPTSTCSGETQAPLTPCTATPAFHTLQPRRRCTALRSHCETCALLAVPGLTRQRQAACCRAPKDEHEAALAQERRSALTLSPGMLAGSTLAGPASGSAPTHSQSPPTH